MKAVLVTEVVPESVQEHVALPVVRGELWKRRWRGTAVDGTSVMVDLAEPTKDGEILAGGGRCFRVQQLPENVVVIPLAEEVELAAKIGWYLGNRHIPIEVRPTELVMEDFPTLIDSLKRIGIPFEEREDVLRCQVQANGHRH